jgi:hypothetical protein
VPTEAPSTQHDYTDPERLFAIAESPDADPAVKMVAGPGVGHALLARAPRWAVSRKPPLSTWLHRARRVYDLVRYALTTSSRASVPTRPLHVGHQAGWRIAHYPSILAGSLAENRIPPWARCGTDGF